MKMEYVKPEIEISVFDTEDIITVSSENIAPVEELADTFYDATYDDLFGH